MKTTRTLQYKKGWWIDVTFTVLKDEIIYNNDFFSEDQQEFIDQYIEDNQERFFEERAEWLLQPEGIE